MQKLKMLWFALAAVLVPSLALAEEETGIDVSGIVSGITGSTAAMVAIGTAILVLLYAVRVFSWARKI